MKMFSMSKSMLVAAFAASIYLMGPSSTALASHGQDINVDTILGNGNGVFAGNYTHSSGTSADHDWYTLDLGVGDQVSLNLTSTGWSSYIWLYDVANEPLQVGDILSTDYFLVGNSGGGNNNNLLYTATAATAGQFAVQVDSYVGGSGAYNLTIRGAAIPEPATLAIFGLSLAGLGLMRRRKKFN